MNLKEKRKYLILVEATGNGCDDYCDTDCSISVGEVTLGELADSDNHDLKMALISALKELLEKGDDLMIGALKNAGWIDRAQAESREEKLVLGKKFVKFNKGMYGQIAEFDLDHIQDQYVWDLAQDDVGVAQIITKASLKKLLSASQREVYEREAKRIRADKEKRVAAAKKRQETKKAKEIEKARKILEEAGEDI